MERLFGRSKTKKSTSSNQSQASPSSPFVANEDESGFAVVSNPTPPPPLYPNVNSTYPVLNPAPATSVTNSTSNNDQAQVTHQRQQSIVGAYLDGVPFALTARCAGSSDVDEATARIERIKDRIQNVDWSSTEYDFRLERSVLNEDLNGSLMRLHAR